MTTGTGNTLIGANAGDALTDSTNNLAVGFFALSADTLGSRSTAIGVGALQVQNFTSATQTYNTAVGYSAGVSVTTGIQNTLIGGQAGDAITDADRNTALGYLALTTNTKSDRNTAIGRSALENLNHTSVTNGLNTAIGHGAGSVITTGTKNTIIGSYSGNAGGLDIRTSSNNIVLSDGDGNPRAYIDSAGTFVTGEISTSAVLNGTGVYINGATGSFYGSATGTQHYFNRQEDGNILSIRRGGTDRGNIGTNSAKLYISSTGNSGLKFRDDLNCIMPCNADGSNSDADQNLGQASVRFQTLFLSGGVRLGGTGTANELDDYEEGTWTPTMGGTTTYYQRTGEYTKVGNKVFVRGQVHINAIGTGSTIQIQGLPFTSKTTTNGNPAGALNITYYSNIAIAVNFIAGHVTSASTNIQVIANAGNNTTIQYNTGNFFGNNARLDFSMVYQAA